MIHTNFKKQFKQSGKGWYKTGLMCKQDKGNLQNSETASLRRLQNFIVKLTKITRFFRTI